MNAKKKFAVLLTAAAIATSSLTPMGAWAATSVTATQSVKVVSSVNFREKPSTSGRQIRMLQKGEQLQLLSKPNSSWLQVKDSRGVTGYVSSSSTYTQIVNTTSVTQKTNATVLKGVNFRKSASTSGSIIRMLNTGEKLTIVEKVNSSWYKAIDSKNVTGYVSTGSQYISTSFSGSGSGSSSAPKPAPAPAPKPSMSTSTFQKLQATGKKYLGTPYEFGSSRSNTKTFDCSDFVKQVFKEAIGITLPGDSRKQGAHVKSIGKTQTDWKKLQPGDLMFFMSYHGSKASDYSKYNKATQRITHVGIYLGNGKIMHTYSKKSGGVRIDSFDNTAWEYRFLFGGPAVK